MKNCNFLKIFILFFSLLFNTYLRGNDSENIPIKKENRVLSSTQKSMAENVVILTMIFTTSYAATAIVSSCVPLIRGADLQLSYGSISGGLGAGLSLSIIFADLLKLDPKQAIATGLVGSAVGLWTISNVFALTSRLLGTRIL